jgi:hypothetical protein
MQTKTKYEEMVLKELRGIPDESIPQIVKILHSIKEGISAARGIKKKGAVKSGICGIWTDDRSADDIIHDIHAHRTGFGGRRVEL